jgi:arylsulfatase A-like enzyme
MFCLVVALSSTVAASSVSAADAAVRPNVVLIMADDVGYECFGANGSTQYKTPRLDEMARRGVRFNHCYSQPLCTPSRVKLMTGLSNARNYVAFSILDRQQRTIGQYFKAAGYRTFVGGKWQLYGAEHYPPRFRAKGTLPAGAGFDEHCLWQVERQGQRYWNPLLNINGEHRRLAEDDYGPDIVAQHINRFMAENRDRPFFVYYPMILVHNPFLPTPASVSRDSKDQQQNFEEMVTQMDTIVGRVVDKTAELGIAERTLILFIGDNGTNRKIRSQLHGRTIQGGKGLTTDAGTRVPMFGYWPKTIPAGGICDSLVDFSDFLPTCLDTIGVDVPDDLDGRSFLPQLRGEPGDPREWMFCYYCPRPERTPPIRFVRDKRFKLYSDGRFYDVAGDPDERRPLDDFADNTAAVAAHHVLTTAIGTMPAEGEMLLELPEK